MYRKKIKIISFICLALCVLVAALVFFSVERYRFEEAAYYPQFDVNTQILPGDKARIDRNEGFATLKVSDGSEIEGTELCAFFRTRKAVLLTSPMLFYQPVGNGLLQQNSLACFTEVEYSSGNSIVSKGEEKKIESGAFLFNGNDSIVLLQPATISFGNHKASLSPLSYVIACYANWVIYCDHDSGKFSFEYLDKDERVTIQLEGMDLTITADTDRATYEGQEYILVPFVSAIQPYLSK